MRMNLIKLSFPVLVIYRQKFRLLLQTILFFGLGSASIFILFSLGATVRMEILRRFHAEGIDLFTVLKRPNASRVAPAQIRYLDLDFLDWLSTPGAPALQVAPERRLTLPIAFRNERFSGFVVGSTEAYQSVFGLRLKTGRFFSFADDFQPHCVVGARVFRRLQTETATDLIGQTLHLGPLAFRIIGALEPSKGFESEYNIDESILVPLSTLRQFAYNPEITRMNVKTDPKAPVVEIYDFILSRLELYLGDASNFEVSNQQVFIDEIQRKVELISLYAGIAGCIFLLAGITSFVNLTRQTVWTRWHSMPQIWGITNRRMRYQIFAEIFSIGFLGWATGWLLGVLMLPWLTGYFGWGLIIPPIAYLATFVIMLVFGAAIGYTLTKPATGTELTLEPRTE